MGSPLGWSVLVFLLIAAPVAVGFWREWTEGATPESPHVHHAAQPGSSEKARPKDALNYSAGVVVGIAFLVGAQVLAAGVVGVALLVGLGRASYVTGGGHAGDEAVLDTVLAFAPLGAVACLGLIAYGSVRACRLGGRKAGLTLVAIVAVLALLPAIMLAPLAGLSIGLAYVPAIAVILVTVLFATRGQSDMRTSPQVSAAVKTTMSATVLAFLRGGSESPAAQHARSLWGVSATESGERHASGLWSAVDFDRLRAVGLMALMAAPFLWIAWQIGTGLPGFGYSPVMSLVASLLFAFVTLSILAYGANRLRRNDAQLPVSVPAVGIALLDTTQDALDAVVLAAGISTPELRLFDSPAANAYVIKARTGLRLAVSRGFTSLPGDEQMAGLAILVGRSRVVVRGREVEPLVRDAMAALSQTSVDSTLSTWIAVAQAGDREALLFLKDPQPIIRLLRRLSGSDNTVLSVPVFGDELFEYLAWPCPLSTSVIRNPFDGAGPQVEPDLAPSEAAVESDGARNLSAEGRPQPTANPEALRLAEILAMTRNSDL